MTLWKKNSSEADSSLAPEDIWSFLRNPKINCSNKIMNCFHCMWSQALDKKVTGNWWEDGMALTNWETVADIAYQYVLACSLFPTLMSNFLCDYYITYVSAVSHARDLCSASHWKQTLVFCYVLDFAWSRSVNDLLRNTKRPSVARRKANSNKVHAMVCRATPQQPASTIHDIHDWYCLQIHNILFTPNFNWNVWNNQHLKGVISARTQNMHKYIAFWILVTETEKPQ
jgi:hypothetical protein